MNCKHCNEPIDFNPDEPYWVGTKTWFHVNAVDGAPDAGRNRNGTYCPDGENEAEPNWEAENANLQARLAEVTAQLALNDELNQAEIDRLRTAYNSCAESRLKLGKANATLRAELERLRGPVCVISDSNYEAGQNLWREWFEGGGRKPPEIPADTALMLTWIVAKFRAELARLTGERDAAREELQITRDSALNWMDRRHSAEASLSQAQQALRDIDFLVCEQAADYLKQLGGGPMEDRLRLLAEQLRAAEAALPSDTPGAQ